MEQASPQTLKLIYTKKQRFKFSGRKAWELVLTQCQEGRVWGSPADFLCHLQQIPLALLHLGLRFSKKEVTKLLQVL